MFYKKYTILLYLMIFILDGLSLVTVKYLFKKPFMLLKNIQ